MGDQLHIETLSASNFRIFKESRFVFNPRLNLIVGLNASGKSSLMAAIRASVGFLVHGLSEQSPSQLEDIDVRLQTDVFENRFRFE